MLVRLTNLERDRSTDPKANAQTLREEFRNEEITTERVAFISEFLPHSMSFKIIRKISLTQNFKRIGVRAKGGPTMKPRVTLS